jgi:hypothetical protein
MNWNRLIITNLPHPLRRVTVFAILQALISPVVRIYNLFVSLRDEQIMNQAGTSQVCMLQKIVHDKLNLSIDIEEDTGLPNDFIVKVASQELDKERRLIALIKKYKLAGKSFTLNNAAVNFVQTWSDYVCEKAAFVQTWSDYVCERISLPDNTITVHAINIPLTTTSDIQVTASLSPLSINITLAIQNTLTFATRTAIITHTRQTADPTPQMIEHTIDHDINEKVVDVGLMAYSDDQYNYILDKLISEV